MSVGPALPRGPRSVFAKLVAIMLIMAVALLAAVSLFLWQIVTPMLNGAVTQAHGELARATAARAPDLAEARAFTDRTGIEVLYEGPRGAWSTSTRARDMRGLVEYHPRLFIATRDVSIVPAADGGRYAFIARFGPNMRSAHTWLFVTLLVIMALVVVVAHAVLRRLLDPLRVLGEGVAQLGEGRFDRLGLPPRRDEFGALSAAFDRMVDRLAAMMRARDQLLVDVSHELRSPITRLKVALELLPAGDPRKGMQADVAEMEAMVGELLELERLRDGRGVQRTAVDLGALASDVARGFDGVPPGVDVEPHDAMVATVDESRVRMVLRNLIENAIKYLAPRQRPGPRAPGAARRRGVHRGARRRRRHPRGRPGPGLRAVLPRRSIALEEDRRLRPRPEHLSTHRRGARRPRHGRPGRAARHAVHGHAAGHGAGRRPDCLSERLTAPSSGRAPRRAAP